MPEDLKTKFEKLHLNDGIYVRGCFVLVKDAQEIQEQQAQYVQVRKTGDKQVDPKVLALMISKSCINSRNALLKLKTKGTNLRCVNLAMHWRRRVSHQNNETWENS